MAGYKKTTPSEAGRIYHTCPAGHVGADRIDCHTKEQAEKIIEDTKKNPHRIFCRQCGKSYALKEYTFEFISYILNK